MNKGARCDTKGFEGAVKGTASDFCSLTCGTCSAPGTAEMYASMIQSNAVDSLHKWEMGDSAWASYGLMDQTFEITFGGQPFFTGTGVDAIWGGLRQGQISTLPTNFPTCKFDGTGTPGVANPETGYDPLCEFNYAILVNAPIVDTSCFDAGCMKTFVDMNGMEKTAMYHGKVSFYYTGVTKQSFDAGEGCGTSSCSWMAGETMQLGYYEMYFDENARVPYMYQNIVWTKAF